MTTVLRYGLRHEILKPYPKIESYVHRVCDRPTAVKALKLEQ